MICSITIIQKKTGVPALKEQPIRTDAVLERVQAQTAAHSQPHKRSRIRMTKWAAGIAAAAVLVTGGTTLAAAAGVGGLDAFFHSLIGEETPENPEKLAALVATPDASFDSTNQDVQFTLLGMYGDDSPGDAELSGDCQGRHGIARTVSNCPIS